MIGNHLDNCLLMARSMLRELIPVIFVNRTQWQLFIRRRFMDKKRSAVSYYTARLKTGQSEANVWVINAIDKREKNGKPAVSPGETEGKNIRCCIYNTA